MSLFVNPARRAGARVVGEIVAVAVLALLAPVASRAAEITFPNHADTFVYAGEPSYNYGAAGSLAVAGPSTPSGEFQSLLKFNTAEAKRFFDGQFGVGGWKLDAATLRLSTSSPNNPLFNPNAAGAFVVNWMQNDAWLEGTGGPITPSTDGVTWASLPSFLGPADESLGTAQFPGGTSGTHAYSLSLTPAFVDDLKAGGDVSLRLAPAEGSAVSYLFASRTFNNVNNRPVLALTATRVPEPGAGLTALGFASLLLRRRSRRA